MPQMMPLLWLILMFSCMFMLILIMTCIHFMYFNNAIYYNNNLTHNKSNWNWKW